MRSHCDERGGPTLRTQGPRKAGLIFRPKAPGKDDEYKDDDDGEEEEKEDAEPRF